LQTLQENNTSARSCGQSSD